MTEKAASTAPAADGPIYSAITGRKDAMAKRSLADLGLAKVTLVYLEEGTLCTLVKIVPQAALAAAVSLLGDAEVT
jgi:hypothetical protein